MDAFAIAGLELRFHSSDHLPHHVHVSRTGKWEIRVWFMTCAEDCLHFSTSWGKGPSQADRKKILNKVLEHRVALLEEWERKTCQDK